MKRFSIVIDAEAAREIDEAEAWTHLHRGRQRADELADEIAKALEYLGRFPRMGARVWTGSTWSTTLRRIILGRTGYHLYYKLQSKARRILVITLWHERRQPPRLR